MKSWNELLEIALIGTDKKGLDSSKLLPEIQSALPETSESERFLNALSLTHFYRKGAVKTQVLSANNGFEFQENRSTITEDLQRILDELLFVEHKWCARLLKQWIQIVNKKEQRLNAVDLTRFLQKIEQENISITQKEIGILGELGIMVARRFERIKPSAFWSEDELLLNGTLAEIKLYLSQLRKVDNDSFVRCLKQNWSSFSLNDQHFWVKTLRISPSFSELEFVSYLLDNEFPPKAKETVNYSRIRSCLITILLSDREADLYKSTYKALGHYIQKQQKGFFTKVFKSETDFYFQLPNSEDDFFNEKVLHETYGLVLDAKMKNVLEERLIAYFTHLISILPFQVWKDLLECSHEQAFKYFKTHKDWNRNSGGENVWILENALLEQIEFSKDDAFLYQFCMQHAKQHNLNVLAKLPFHLLEKAILKKEIKLDLSEFTIVFQEFEGYEFSPEMASFAINESWKNFQDTNTYNLHSFVSLTHLMPISVARELESLIYNNNSSDEKALWVQAIATPILGYLKLKQQIEKL